MRQKLVKRDNMISRRTERRWEQIVIGIVPRFTQQGVFDLLGKPHSQIETPDARCREETPRNRHWNELEIYQRRLEEQHAR